MPNDRVCTCHNISRKDIYAIFHGEEDVICGTIEVVGSRLVYGSDLGLFSWNPISFLKHLCSQCRRNDETPKYGYATQPSVALIFEPSLRFPSGYRCFRVLASNSSIASVVLQLWRDSNAQGGRLRARSMRQLASQVPGHPRSSSWASLGALDVSSDILLVPILS